MAYYTEYLEYPDELISLEMTTLSCCSYALSILKIQPTVEN